MLEGRAIKYIYQ